ncbi:autotransporter assembly complex family protein [Marinobacter lacisalsi]|uniref:Translocation and assembly module subunit TamA n=1 Tax=Marinobacter lacisalsi TaxID=475979 RepID=A0ABV8QLS7_9GAMM
MQINQASGRYRTCNRVFGLLAWAALSLTPVASLADQVEIRMEGDYPGLLDNARAFVGDVEDHSLSSLRRYGDTVDERIRQALRALGYYDPTIARNIRDEDPPVLVMEVSPGEPVRVVSRDVTITGPAQDDSLFMATLPKQPAVGDVLNHGAYDSLRQTLSNRASRLGYFDGTFEQRRLEVDPEAREARIFLHFASGERYRLGDVTFNEDQVFKQSFLERFVQFEPGTPYHADEIADLSADLTNSGYFSQALVTAPPSDAEDGVIPVSARVSEREPRSLGAGIGYSTDVGPRFRGNWKEHWINPQGHQRGADTELSVPRQNITGWYEIPLDPPMTDSMRFGVGYQREDIEDVQSDRLTLGSQWRHLMDNDWTRVLSLRWERERFDIGNAESGTTRLLMPGISLSKLQSDSPIDPTHGYRLQMDVTGGSRELFSTVDVAQVTTQAKGLITIADDHRFLARVEAGAVATNDFSDVPPSLRFFTGGDQSVRGYGYETLTPKDSSGTGLGGRYKLVGSIEYQYEVVDNWRVAAFMDEGNALDHLDEPLATGVGVGVRWISPVGPLRLDIARGLDEEFGGGWRIHFSMGPEL